MHEQNKTVVSDCYCSCGRQLCLEFQRMTEVNISEKFESFFTATRIELILNTVNGADCAPFLHAAKNSNVVGKCSNVVDENVMIDRCPLNKRNHF